MAKFMNPTKVITGPNTTFSYLNCWDAKSINGSTPKFSVSLIIPKSDIATIEKIKAAIQAAYEEGQSKLKGNGKSVPPLTAIKTPLRDGDLERPDDETYANSYFINANSGTAPDLAEARSLVRDGNFDALDILYDNVPGVLSELIRTAFVPKDGYKYIVADFSAIEARVLSFLANEKWRIDVFREGKDIYCASASQMFKVPVEKHGQNAHLRQKGKIAELALGYGGSVGALRAMGAIEMGLEEEELQPLVDAWRNANSNITSFWWQIDSAVKQAVIQKKSCEVGFLKIYYQSGMLFIDLPSGRRLCYVKPKMGTNQFGSESVTYEGINTGKWTRIESYGPKFVENIVQAISRDILAYAMRTLAHTFIVGSVHDELIIECSPDVSVEAICEQMGRTPPWISGLLLRADGYECPFYKKD